jgi:hypothetical protein
MRNSERRVGERVGRALVIGVGGLAALGAFDAFVFFVVLILASLFVGPPGPYIGLLFVALPVLVLVGVLIAWVAWATLHGEPTDNDVRT